jgi:Fe-S cluster assembly scaffold protein SufB
MSNINPHAILKIEGFEELGQAPLPNRQNESWRYTSLQKLKNQQFRLLESTHTPTSFDLDSYSEFAVLLVDGTKAYPLSDDIHETAVPANMPQNDLNVDQDFFSKLDSYLNTKQQHFTYASTKPLLIYYSQPDTQHSGLMAHIKIDVLSSCEIVEYAPQSNQSFFQRYHLEFSLHQNLEFRSIHLRADAGFRFVKYGFTLYDKAQLLFESYDEGAAIARNELDLRYTAPDQKAELRSLGHVRSNCHLNQETSITHDFANCETQQDYKHIVEDEAVAVFAGRMHIKEPGSIAKQLNRNLLLGPKAHAFTRPMLLIDCSDVVCSHGASVSRPSEDELFYLRARGIDEADAKKILATAFARLPEALAARIQYLRNLSDATS